MKRNISWILLVLCCVAFSVAGCAKKEMVKSEETPAQPETVKTEPAPPAPTPEPVTEAPVVNETPVAVPAAPVQTLESVYFDFDSYVLRADARDQLAKNAEMMMKNPSETFQLAGNCDERGSDEYNLALGEKRAKAAEKYLITLGVPASNLTTISYGKEKPVDPGHDEAAWAKNRRVDFVVVK